jgi:hypothetical protein
MRAPHHLATQNFRSLSESPGRPRSTSGEGCTKMTKAVAFEPRSMLVAETTPALIHAPRG